MDRTKAPAASEIDRPNLPSFEKIELTSDLELITLNQGKQEVVLLEMIYPVGRFQETSPGLAFYLFKMLTEGTSKHSSEQIASAFDFYGSHVEITPTLDHVSIKLYSLSRFFGQVLELFCELLQDSIFPEKEFDIIKQIRVQQIKQQEAKNNIFASLKFREILYGQSHPYGRMVTIDQANSTTITDLHNFRSALSIKPLLFLTGKISDTEISLLKSFFGQFKFEQDLNSQDYSIESGTSSTIKKSGSTQASIRMGKTIINRSHPDIHLLKITNEILGGFFGSRLMKNIREDKGLTYGIHSSILHLQHSSYWSINSEVLLDKVELALSEINRELDLLCTNTPTDQELHMVKNYMKGKFLSSFDSPFSSHNMLKNVVLDGLDVSYFFEYFDTLQNIGKQDITDTASKYFSKESITTLIVE